MTDITFGPEHNPAERYPFAWSFGTGRFAPTGDVSCSSDSIEIGSAVDGAGVGFTFDVTTERGAWVIPRLRAMASSRVIGLWGYANAEPMFDVWLIGMSPSVRDQAWNYQVGISLRAVAPVFGFVDLRDQSRTGNPVLQVSLPFPVRPGTYFAGAGVRTYAGTGGFFCAAHADISAVVSSIRVYTA